MKLDTFRTGLTNCILNQDPLFEDKDNYIYAADSVISPMVNRGINLGIFNDIKARPRDAMPDIGAFEF
jgi:hypothetical protein